MKDIIQKAFEKEFGDFEFESEFDKRVTRGALTLFMLNSVDMEKMTEEQINVEVKKFREEYITLRQENNIKMSNLYEAMDSLSDFFETSTMDEISNSEEYEDVIEKIKKGDSIDGAFSLKADDITKAISDLELNIESVKIKDIYTDEKTNSDVYIIEEVWTSSKNQSTVVQSYPLTNSIFEKKPDEAKKAVLDLLFGEGLYALLLTYIKSLSANSQIEMSDKYRESLAVKEDYENAAIFRDFITNFHAK